MFKHLKGKEIQNQNGERERTKIAKVNHEVLHVGITETVDY